MMNRAAGVWETGASVIQRSHAEPLQNTSEQKHKAQKQYHTQGSTQHTLDYFFIDSYETLQESCMHVCIDMDSGRY